MALTHKSLKKVACVYPQLTFYVTRTCNGTQISAVIETAQIVLDAAKASGGRLCDHVQVVTLFPMPKESAYLMDPRITLFWRWEKSHDLGEVLGCLLRHLGWRDQPDNDSDNTDRYISIWPEAMAPINSSSGSSTVASQ